MQNETVALLEAQLSQLRTEKHFLLNSVVTSQKKDEIIQILIDQLKYNAPRQYLLETASQIRKIVDEAEFGQNHAKDKDIDRVCQMLEAPVDLVRCYFDVTYNFLKFPSLLIGLTPRFNFSFYHRNHLYNYFSVAGEGTRPLFLLLSQNNVTLATKIWYEGLQSSTMQ